MTDLVSGLGRRGFLSGALGLTGVAMLPGKASAGLLSAGERVLNFYNTHTGEKVKAAYWAAGQFVSDGLSEIDHILRDFRTGEVLEIDRALLDQLVRVRSLVGASPSQEVHIISGYRSHQTNEALRSASSGVAKKSQHQLGKAIDLRMPGIDLSNLRKAAMSMKAGGVGFYPQSRNNFVHMDTGRVRYW